ncbi:MAG: response regulator [Bacteroidetes bacterium]|nr:response regulator [Bacteroidota bacterium]
MEKDDTIDILIVEDNVHDAELALRALDKKNIQHKFLHLKDGVSALDYLFGTGEFKGRNTFNKPKVILLDLKMPKINGIEVLQQIKSSRITRNIPVVVLTSSKEITDVVKCYSLGANSYIVKPVDFELFSQAVVEIGVYWLHFNQPPI